MLQLGILSISCARTTQPEPGQEIAWAAYGRDGLGTRVSPASGITRDNVHQLEVAWTYRTGEADSRFATTEPTSFQATPVMVDGSMYLSTPLGRVISLDPATGQERWVFDPEIRRDIRYGDFASRGVSTWVDDEARLGAACHRTIYVATAQSELIALDAHDGRPCVAFGRDGRVDLKQGLRIPPFEAGAYTVTSPPVVANGLVVVGSSIGDNSRPNPASGEIRAFDARTGALRWTLGSRAAGSEPIRPNEWRGDDRRTAGAANAWSIMSVDPERDLVFVPTSSPAPDYYGALRLGSNRYANSIVALRLSTGALVWEFQTVHHDLWDYDNAAQPTLATLTHDGAEIQPCCRPRRPACCSSSTVKPASQSSRSRNAGSRRATFRAKKAAPTQPFTARIPPLSPHGFTPEDAWGVNEADRAACRVVFEGLRNQGIFTPPGTRGTLAIPSNIGGAHWGGVPSIPWTDCSPASKPGCIDGAADSARRIRWRSLSCGGRTPRSRLRIQHDARHPLCHAPSHRAQLLRGCPARRHHGARSSPSTSRMVACCGKRLSARSPGRSAQSGQHKSERNGVPPIWAVPISTAGGIVFIAAALDCWLRAYTSKPVGNSGVDRCRRADGRLP